MIPITPRAAGSGLSGGAVPIYGGILLSVERMNDIFEVDDKNLMAVVAPGVVRNFGDLPSYVGEMAGGLSDRAERLAAAFTRAGLQTSASDDIVHVIWKKLLANIALSALSGATNLNATQIMAIPPARRPPKNARPPSQIRKASTTLPRACGWVIT